MGRMMSGRIGVRGALVSVVAVAAVATSSCGSDGGGSAGPSSSAGSPSVSVAAGVEKDSVLDLNSTKDMTGVVTTVPIGKSPYDKNMPDICGFITQAAMEQLGVETKKKGFYGSPLVFQSCLLRPPPSFIVDYSIGANIYINNLQEHLASPNLERIQKDPVPIFGDVKGYLLRNRANDSAGGTYLCEVAWGTFYGTAAVDIGDNKSGDKLCSRTVDAAKVLGPLMPKSPSQMRPTS